MNEEIRKIYVRTGYLENDGTNVLLALLIIVVTFSMVGYNSSQAVLKMMQTNWASNKCNPIYMPFAGVVMPIPGVTTFDNAFNNFNYCIQSDLSAVFSAIMLPIEFGLFLTVQCIDAAIYASALVTKLMQMFQSLFGGIFKDLFDKIIDFIVPIVIICLNTRDAMAKINGIMITVIFTIMSVYNLTISGTSSMLNLFLDVVIMFIGIVIALMVIAFVLVAFFFTGPLGIAVAAVATSLAGVAIGFIILYEVMDSFSQEVFNTPRRKGPSVPSTSL